MELCVDTTRGAQDWVECHGHDTKGLNHENPKTKPPQSQKESGLGHHHLQKTSHTQRVI